MDSHLEAEGYNELRSPDIPYLEFLEDKEEMKSYCLKNGLKPGTTDNMHTGTIGSKRYFVRENPVTWDIASHLVADAFMQQYDFETPEVEYSNGDVLISSKGNPPVPLDSIKREFRIREAIPNALQPPMVEPSSVSDSLFVHLAGGAHDINGNTVITRNIAYPIDFQTFGKPSESPTLRKFLNGKENYAEKKFSEYGNRLGFDPQHSEFRRNVRKRSEEFNEDQFWEEINSVLGGVEENLAESTERFAENTVEYVEKLAEIEVK